MMVTPWQICPPVIHQKSSCELLGEVAHNDGYALEILSFGYPLEIVWQTAWLGSPATMMGTPWKSCPPVIHWNHLANCLVRLPTMIGTPWKSCPRVIHWKSSGELLGEVTHNDRYALEILSSRYPLEIIWRTAWWGCPQWYVRLGNIVLQLSIGNHLANCLVQ